MADQQQKYRQAAVAYFIYGVIYLAGAIYAAQTGISERSVSTGSGIAWLLFGVIILVLFPPLIWKGFKWFTRILTVLVAIRIYGLIRVIIHDTGQTVPLPWGAELPMSYGAAAFMIVALATCIMLARAGWDFW